MLRHALMGAALIVVAGCSSSRDRTTADSIPTLRASTPDEVKAIRDSVAAAQAGTARPATSSSAKDAWDSVADARAESTLFANRTKSMTSIKRCLAQLSPDMSPQSRKAVEVACQHAATLKGQ